MVIEGPGDRMSWVIRRTLVYLAVLSTLNDLADLVRPANFPEASQAGGSDGSGQVQRFQPWLLLVFARDPQVSPRQKVDKICNPKSSTRFVHRWPIKTTQYKHC